MNNLRNILFFFVIFVLSSQFTIAQSDFVEGMYITLSNDTIHGLINDRGGSGNFFSCTFKTEKSAKTKKFSPEEIQAYQFQDGRLYVAKSIYVDSVKIKAFVEFLVDGISDLYYYRDQENFFYIIENEEGEIIELQREKPTDIKIAEKDWDPWIHIRKLKVAFSNSMEIQPQIEQVDFTHKSLIRLTRDYHNCVCDEYECIVYEKKMGFPTIYIAPIIGRSFTNLSFTNGFLSRFQFEQNANTSFGGQIDAVLSMINKSYSVQFEVLYQKNQFYGTQTDATDTYYQIFINNNLMQYAVSLKYRFLLGAIRPSIAAGMTFSSLRNLNYDEIITQPGMEVLNIDNPSIFIDSNIAGMIVQLGLNYRILENREIFTNFRYAFSSTSSVFGPSSTNNTGKAKFSTISFVFGFYLNKVK